MKGLTMQIVMIISVKVVPIKKMTKMIFLKSNYKLCLIQLKTVISLVKIEINTEKLEKLTLLLVKQNS